MIEPGIPDELSQIIIPGTTSQRIERKYPLCVVALDHTLDELKSLLPVYHYDGPNDWSTIRTTYLDTPGFQCYQEYLQDLPVRRKVRIRQYGVDGRFGSLCWFEFKLKHASLSMKRRFCCALADAERFLKKEDIFERIGPPDGTDLRQAYNLIRSAVTDMKLTPVIRIDYERISFQKPDDPNLRVTLDRDLRFCSASREHKGRLEGLVLEVKYAEARPEWLPVLQERLGARRKKRYSKFGRSMKRLNKLRKSEAT